VAWTQEIGADNNQDNKLMDILEIFRQAIKGGGDRLGQQFSPFSEEERQANMNQQPNFPGYSTPAGADAGGIADNFRDMRQVNGSLTETFPSRGPSSGNIPDNFRDMQRVNGSLTETFPSNGSLAAQFAPQGARPMGFPGVDDMQHHRGVGYTVPDAARRDIMAGHDAGRDYGYEGPGQYPDDVVHRVLTEERARRRNMAMPGSPVNY
jgi:hypothetical protein